MDWVRHILLSRHLGNGLETAMRRRHVIRERNDRGFHLFMQNLKGIISIFLAPQEITWTEELIEQTSRRLEEAYATLILLVQDVSHGAQTSDPLIESLHQLLSYIQSLHSYTISSESTLINDPDVSFSTQCVERTGGEGPGRPRLDVGKDQIEYLHAMHFSWEKIAQLLQVSLSTLQRRRRAFGFDDHLEQYSAISDHDLDEIYKELTVPDVSSSGGSLTPNIGRRRFIGALRSQGIHVQCWRVSQCLRRVDPIGTALRWRLVIYRRKYNVPTPNSLWHFDSAHKLIRWKLVVHVCIDVFSRLLIYCRCCDNNKAETILELFKEGTQKYGIPSRARCDYGMENLLVGQFMLGQRGLDGGSIITGSSVHNCRVERTRRDVYAGVLCFFAQLFNEMENNGILDPLNDLHLYCLHFIYLPRINRSLQEFVAQMNNRPVSTERNNSPLQLWTSGMLLNINSSHIALTEGELEQYGIDPEGLVNVSDEDYQVHVNPPTCELTETQMMQLPDPLQNDGHQGQHAYLRCIELISSFQ